MPARHVPHRFLTAMTGLFIGAGVLLSSTLIWSGVTYAHVATFQVQGVDPGGVVNASLSSTSATNMAPGDTAVKTVTVTNPETFAVSYSMTDTVSGPLFSGSTPAQVSFTGGQGELPPKGTTSVTVAVTLPLDAGNSYQGLQGQVVVNVVLTQLVTNQTFTPKQTGLTTPPPTGGGGTGTFLLGNTQQVTNLIGNARFTRKVEIEAEFGSPYWRTAERDIGPCLLIPSTLVAGGVSISVTPAQVAEIKDKGLSCASFEMGRLGIVTLPLQDLELTSLARTDPALAGVSTNSILVFDVNLDKVHLRLPVGARGTWTQAGPGITYGLYVHPDAGTVIAVHRLPAPGQATVIFSQKLVSNTSLVSLWQMNGAGVPVYVPSDQSISSGLVTMSLTHFGTYYPLEYDVPFVDTDNSWGAKDVAVAAAHLLASGMGGDHFAPDGRVTRAQFAALLVRALDLPTSQGPSTFGDVPTGAWYEPSVEAVARAGLMGAVKGSDFRPGADISRESMAVIISRVLAVWHEGLKPGVTPGEVLARYKDGNKVASWARRDMAIAIENGILRGIATRYLDPRAPTTRAQTMAMLVHLFGV